MRCGSPASTSPSWSQAHRRHVIEAMHQYTRLKEDAADDDIGLLLVADAEIYRLDAVVRWLDAADARIKRLPPPRREPSSPRPGPGCAARSGAGDDRRARDAPGVEVVRRRARPLVDALRRCRPHRASPASWWRSWARAARARARCSPSPARSRRRRAGTSASTGSDTVGDVAQRSGAPAAPLDRLRVPGLQPAGRADRGRERVAAARARRHAEQGGARSPRSRRSTSSGSPTAPSASPTSCRVASASASRSPGPSSAIGGCCWPTSRPARSTRSTARA